MKELAHFKESKDKNYYLLKIKDMSECLKYLLNINNEFYRKYDLNYGGYEKNNNSFVVINFNRENKLQFSMIIQFTIKINIAWLMDLTYDLTHYIKQFLSREAIYYAEKYYMNKFYGV